MTLKPVVHDTDTPPQSVLVASSTPGFTTWGAPL
jgi:hypothetical protein